MKLLRLRRLIARCREPIRPRAWLLLLPVVLLLAMAAGAAHLAWQGFALLNRDDLATSETAAAIQGLAAALSLAVTVCLVGVTGWYAYLVNKQTRLSGPDVSMDWYIAWAHPSGLSTSALRASITDLYRGPMSEQHTEWFFAVDLTNSGSHAVQVIQIFLTCDDSAKHHYGGSIYSNPCPIILDAHSSQNFFFKPDDARQFIEMCKHLKTKQRHRLQVYVDLGSGIRLSSKKVLLRRFIVES